MKILALDLGDKWVGVALSDASRIIARPYKTISFHELINFLKELFEQESISTVLVGCPTTLRGTKSEQTQKIITQKDALENLFSEKKWILCDERLTSKQVVALQSETGKMKNKLEIHARCAALILDSYLAYIRFQEELEEKF